MICAGEMRGGRPIVSMAIAISQPRRQVRPAVNHDARGCCLLALCLCCSSFAASSLADCRVLLACRCLSFVGCVLLLVVIPIRAFSQRRSIQFLRLPPLAGWLADDNNASTNAVCRWPRMSGAQAFNALVVAGKMRAAASIRLQHVARHRRPTFASLLSHSHTRTRLGLGLTGWLEAPLPAPCEAAKN